MAIEMIKDMALTIVTNELLFSAYFQIKTSLIGCEEKKSTIKTRLGDFVIKTMRVLIFKVYTFRK